MTFRHFKPLRQKNMNKLLRKIIKALILFTLIVFLTNTRIKDAAYYCGAEKIIRSRLNNNYYGKANLIDHYYAKNKRAYHFIIRDKNGIESRISYLITENKIKDEYYYKKIIYNNAVMRAELLKSLQIAEDVHVSSEPERNGIINDNNKDLNTIKNAFIRICKCGSAAEFKEKCDQIKNKLSEMKTSFNYKIYSITDDRMIYVCNANSIYIINDIKHLTE